MDCTAEHSSGAVCKLPRGHYSEGFVYHQNGALKWAAGPSIGACINPQHDNQNAHAADESPDCYGNGDVTEDPAYAFTAPARTVTTKMYHPNDVMTVHDRTGDIAGYIIREQGQ